MLKDDRNVKRCQKMLQNAKNCNIKKEGDDGQEENSSYGS